MKTMRFACLSLLALTLSACSQKPVQEAPKVGSLTQRLSMVDADGRTYGLVEIDPVNGGKVLDGQGRLIGYIVPPSRAAVAAAPAPAPVPVQYYAAPIPAPAPVAMPAPVPAPAPVQTMAPASPSPGYYSPQQPIYAPQPLR